MLVKKPGNTTVDELVAGWANFFFFFSLIITSHWFAYCQGHQKAMENFLPKCWDCWLVLFLDEKNVKNVKNLQSLCPQVSLQETIFYY